jgi:hypothetical protein
MVVANLFADQSEPWKEMVRKHVNEVWIAAKDFLGLVVAHVADAATSRALMRKIVEPELETILVTLKASSAELLKPHQEGHPITYNHYFTENLQKLRYDRMHDQFATVVKKFFSTSSLESVSNFHGDRDLRPLLDSLLKLTEPDMNCLAASEALDCLESYYKVSYLPFQRRAA